MSRAPGDALAQTTTAFRRGIRALSVGVAVLAVAPATASAAGGTAPAYLPDPTCAPSPTPVDDAAHAFHAADAHVVKVLYAHASNASDDFATVYPKLGQGVRDMVEYVYVESGELKSIRFDLGTASGPDCVDVQAIGLPHPAAYYDPANPTAARQKIVDDLQPLLGAQPGQRDFLVFVDGIANDRAAITGPSPADDSPAGPSWQVGGKYSVVFDNPFSFDLSQAFGRLGLHELFHAFGAVQATAPHYGGGGHCTERQDLMCDPGFGGPIVCDFRDYPTIDWDTPEGRLDCGGDDYFNPAPGPGSYLTTHWNTYNSPFLCDVGTCVPDNVAPRTQIKGPRRTSDRTPRFKLRADERAVEFKCKLDRGRFRSCAARFKPKRLEVGRHKLKAVATDASGNADRSAAVKRFRITGR